MRRVVAQLDAACDTLYDQPFYGGALMLYLVEGAVDGREPHAGEAWAPRVRTGVVLVGLAALCAAVVNLALPRTPGDGSAEVGFARDVVVHDASLRDVLAALDVNGVDAGTRELLVDIDAIVATHDEQAIDLLEQWGQAASTGRVPMSWMGHVLEGNTPGAMSPELLARSEALDGDDVAAVMSELVGHLRGGVLMARGILALSDNADVQAFAAALAADRNRLRDRVDAWFVDRGQLPPTWLPLMTTDPRASSTTVTR
jgi:hypothetical protein